MKQEDQEQTHLFIVELSTGEQYKVEKRMDIISFGKNLAERGGFFIEITGRKIWFPIHSIKRVVEEV